MQTHLKKVLVLLLVLLTAAFSANAEAGETLLVQYQTVYSSPEGYVPGSAAGMGYILKADNGELFVIDGGNAEDGYRFLQLLKEVSGEEKPHVSVWFLSHPHSDHYGALRQIADYYRNHLTVDAIMANFPPRDLVDTVKSTSYAPGAAALDTIRYTLNADLIMPHTGDTFEVGNITVDIVTTWEDLKPVNDVNETSIVLMVKTEGKKVLFLGDAYAATCKNAIANYGDRLDCDMVQVAHHAVNGGSVALYKATGAKLYLIPNNRESVEKAKKKDTVVYWIMNNAPETVFAGDGTKYFSLSRSENGQ